jgi:hypothetical protein
MNLHRIVETTEVVYGIKVLSGASHVSDILTFSINLAANSVAATNKQIWNASADITDMYRICIAVRLYCNAPQTNDNYQIWLVIRSAICLY